MNKKDNKNGKSMILYSNREKMSFNCQNKYKKKVFFSFIIEMLISA